MSKKNENSCKQRNEMERHLKAYVEFLNWSVFPRKKTTQTSDIFLPMLDDMDDEEGLKNRGPGLMDQISAGKEIREWIEGIESKEKLTEEDIQQWASKHDQYNVAVRTGRDSGIVVLAVERNDAPDCPCIDRGNGEWEAYYKRPDVEKTIPTGWFQPNVYMYADGGELLVPPSTDRKGKICNWCSNTGENWFDNHIPNDISEIPALPDYILEKIY